MTAVQGNTCPRGDAYGPQGSDEPHPHRHQHRAGQGRRPGPPVSCKTRSDVPKGKIFDVVRALKGVEVPAPVSIGQVLLEDAAGTGVAVVATKNVDAKP